MDKEGYFGKKSLTPDFLDSNKLRGKDSKNEEDEEGTPASLSKRAKDATKDAVKEAGKDTALSAAGKALGATTGTGPIAETALKKAESVASKHGVGLNDIANLERSPSLFTGSGGEGNKKKKSKIRKALPLILIVLLLGFGGVAIFAATMLLGAHISANTSNLTNFSRTAVVETEKTLLAWLSKNNELPKSLQQRLLDAGAESVSDSTIVYEGNSYSGDAIATAMTDNTSFAELINTATYSNVLDYHDTAANETYDDLAQNRNVFKDFDGGSDEVAYDNLRTEAAGGSSEATARTATEEETDSTTSCPAGYTEQTNGSCKSDGDGSSTSKTTSCPAGYELDANGKCVIDTTSSASKTNSSEPSDAAIASATSYLQELVKKVTDSKDISGIFTGAISYGCSIWTIGNIISLAIEASDTYSSINYFMDTMESISKAMAGQGDQSGINQTYNYFSTPTTETVVNPDGTESTVTGSPLMSEWAKSTLGGVQSDTSKTQSFSFSRIAAILTSDVGKNTVFAILQQTGLLTDSAIAKTCAYAGIASSMIAIGGILAGGVIQIAVSAILGIVNTVASYKTFEFLIPTIAKALFMNQYNSYENGVPGGEEFGRGATAANSRISRSASGLMPASESNSLAYQKLQAETIARDNAIDRIRRSPFDASSPNTFLGSILNKFAFTPIFNGNTMLANFASGNLFSAASSIANAAMSSINTSIYAATSDELNINYYYTTHAECPDQKNIDVTGDMYCNPFEAADDSMFSYTPDDLAKVKYITDSFDSNNKVIIDSGLYYFIQYAANRNSPWGAYDANIAEEICGSDDGILGGLPIIKQIRNINENSCILKIMDIATGEYYAYSENNTHWDEVKYYQAYVSQARILDRLGYYEERGETSPVILSRAEYKAEHPFDNSRAGVLARTSGLPKSTAEYVLALYDYGNIIANYDPSERYAFVETPDPLETVPDFKTDDTFNTVIATTLTNRKYYIVIRQEGITA